MAAQTRLPAFTLQNQPARHPAIWVGPTAKRSNQAANTIRWGKKRNGDLETQNFASQPECRSPRPDRNNPRPFRETGGCRLRTPRLLRRGSTRVDTHSLHRNRADRISLSARNTFGLRWSRQTTQLPSLDAHGHMVDNAFRNDGQFATVLTPALLAVPFHITLRVNFLATDHPCIDWKNLLTAS